VNKTYMRWIYLVIPALILTGCAGSPLGNLIFNKRYQTSKDVSASWVGASADELMMAWGPPQNSQALSNGSSILVYQYDWIVNGYDSSMWNYIPEYSHCERRFLVEQGIVTKWYSSGGCPKKPKGAKLIDGNVPVPEPTL